MKWQCSCPNNIRHKNIMRDFNKVSMVAVNKAVEQVGIEEDGLR